MCVHVVHVCACMWKREVDTGFFLDCSPPIYPEAWSLPELTEPAGLGSQSVSFTVTVGGATTSPGLKCALGL